MGWDLALVREKPHALISEKKKMPGSARTVGKGTSTAALQAKWNQSFGNRLTYDQFTYTDL